MTENVQDQAAQEPVKTEEVKAAEPVKTEEVKAAEPEKNPLEKSVEFTVSAEELKKGTEEALKRYAKKAKIAGFRPGHVPAATVRAMYGHDAYVETLNDLIVREFDKAAQEAKLMMVGQPEITPVETKEGEDLRFKAVVECYPEFTLPSFADLQLKRYVCPVTDAEVDKTVDVMRKQRATLVDEQGRKAADEDVLTIDFKGMKDGVAFEGGTAENFQMVVGAGRMLPEFEEAVRGMGVGETKAFKLPFPADYPEKSLAGTTADFEVTVKAIKTPVLPELNDEFAKKLGQDSVDALRAEVRKNLEREVKARLLSRTKVEVMDAVAKLAPFPAPKAMTEQEQEHLAQEAVQNLKQFGLDPKKAPKLPLDMFKPEAQKRVVLGILVHKLVQEKNLLATQEDIENLAGEIAASYEDAEAVKKEFLSDKNQVNAFGNVATETKVVEYVLSQAQTTEETVPFDGLMKK